MSYFFCVSGFTLSELLECSGKSTPFCTRKYQFPCWRRHITTIFQLWTKLLSSVVPLWICVHPSFLSNETPCYNVTVFCFWNDLLKMGQKIVQLIADVLNFLFQPSEFSFVENFHIKNSYIFLGLLSTSQFLKCGFRQFLL